jgi:hypothetical protein
MPLFDTFSHYLAYLATDQETFRDLRGSYNGVLVPGTIAAWQRQGTGGFVLSLSASEPAASYVIDPRFPLFQQALPEAKQSHTALADIFGDPSLVQGAEPLPAQFSDERLRRIASAWVEFNTAYGAGTTNKTFDKYAARLGEDPPAQSIDARAPEAILAPYFVAQAVTDDWWGRSKQLFEATCAVAQDTTCLRVVCAAHPGILAELLDDVTDSELVVWVSGLDEHKASVPDLSAYRLALAAAASRNQAIFALYGGFFSVLLSGVGLDGAAHGVGFSEHRNWRELPQSGAPPARFYVRRWHRYVSQDLGQILWAADHTLVQCPCPHCAGRAPNSLSYHDLMKHSVWCRQDEIDHWADQPHTTVARLLTDEYAASLQQITALSLLPTLRNRAVEAIAHLPRWAAALVA